MLSLLKSITERERHLYNQLVRLFRPYITSVASSIVESGTFDIATLSEELRAVLIRELQQIFLNDLDMIVLRDGLPAFDIDDLGTAAGDWAFRNATDIEQKITANTEKDIRQVMRQYLDTPGMTRADVEAMMPTSFGKRRAESIAITETTRASAAATNALKAHYQERYELTYERMWNTNVDEQVCQICGPLNNKPESKWIDRYPDGPPAHPRCRCFVTLKRTGK